MIQEKKEQAEMKRYSKINSLSAHFSALSIFYMKEKYWLKKKKKEYFCQV